MDSAELPPSIQPGIRDTRLIQRAIRQRWPIPDDKRQALIDRQIEIATSKETEPREATAAFKAVMEAEKQNIAAEQKPRRKPKNIPPQQTVVFMEGSIDDVKRQLTERANRIGVNDGGVGADPPPVAGTGDTARN